MGDIVIVGYRPKAGCENELVALTRDHVPELRRLGLATNRASIVMRSKEGVIVEVFEWCDGAMRAAHTNSGILAMWERYVAVCDYVLLHELPETRNMFAQFAPLDI